MKVKTSITLSRDVLQDIDRVAGKGANRSRVIEEALRSWVAQRARAAREARDREILDRDADALNDEMVDVLRYQAKL